MMGRMIGLLSCLRGFLAYEAYTAGERKRLTIGFVSLLFVIIEFLDHYLNRLQESFRLLCLLPLRLARTFYRS